MITFLNTDLSSRSSAATVRFRVQGEIHNGRVVSFDFDNVECVSSAYADELFGTLSKWYGADRVINLINIVNAKDHILETIVDAIHRRIKWGVKK